MAARKARDRTEKKKRLKPDWEEIESLYRADIVSTRVIAAKHGIAESYIRKKAKEKGWAKDLSAKVRRAAKEKLVRSSAQDSAHDSAQHKPKRRTDEEIIDEKAELLASVVRSHQKTIGAGRKLLSKLLTELQDASDNRDEIEEAIEEETQDDSKRRASMLKAVSLQSRAGIMLNLSAAAKNFIALERAAFNMDEQAVSESTLSIAQIIEQRYRPPGMGAEGAAQLA